MRVRGLLKEVYLKHNAVWIGLGVKDIHLHTCYSFCVLVCLNGGY